MKMRTPEEEQHEKMHQGGTLLDYVQSLRSSSNGSSDPLRDEEIAEIRAWLSYRVEHWRPTDDEHDALVRRMCIHALGAYHVPTEAV